MHNRHDVVLRVTKAGYGPHDKAAKAQHAKLCPGLLVGARIARSRSIVQNKLYWAVLGAVVDATGKWGSAEELHLALKVATGHVDLVHLIDGRLVKVPGSTSFDAMNQEEFQAYMDHAFRILSDDVGFDVERALEAA